MRPLALALLVLSAPAVAAAQSAPRSLALELGFARDSSDALGDRAPVALLATWWLTGDLDATARIAWGFAARTSGRAAASFEAGVGLRHALVTWRAVRPQVVADVAFVQVLGTPASEAWAADSGVRAGVGVALEVFLARDVSLSLTARVTELALASGEGGPGLATALGLAAYF
jgi:hypothetical protein